MAFELFGHLDGVSFAILLCLFAEMLNRKVGYQRIITHFASLLLVSCFML